jgi:hypothetical protein
MPKYKVYTTRVEEVDAKSEHEAMLKFAGNGVVKQSAVLVPEKRYAAGTTFKSGNAVLMLIPMFNKSICTTRNQSQEADYFDLILIEGASIDIGLSYGGVKIPNNKGVSLKEIVDKYWTLREGDYKAEVLKPVYYEG